MSKPPATLTLQIGSSSVSFPGVDAFKFALASRTSAPLSKLDDLQALSLDDLMAQARSIRAVEGRLLGVLDESIGQPLTIDHRLRELDSRVFSEDHDWRAIMTALDDADSSFDDYKRVAVVKYLQYLASRQEMIKRVYQSKTLGEDHDESGTDQLRETAIFDRFAIAAAGDKPQWVRLPRGEATSLRLAPGERIPLRLSTHVFELRRDASGLSLHGERDDRYDVPSTRCRVGRSHDNEVSLYPAYRAVSRRHLVLEPGDGDSLTVTDLSSHGSFARPEDLS